MKDGAVSLASTTYQRVHAAMVADIISGQLEPGARLKIGQLASRYDVSQMPIREALQRLQGEGLVILTPNHGASVRTFDEKFISDIYELRAELGAVVYRDLFAALTPEIIEELETIQRRYDKAAEKNDAKQCQIENIKFHHVITSRCQNQEVMRILSMQDRLVRTLRQMVGYTHHRIQQQGAEHWEIIDAIKARDLQRTISAARQHGLGSGADIIAHFRDQVLKPRKPGKTPKTARSAA
ncbi:MAG: hypothetical protein ABS76_30750 [Pelagibacterium sp. SCN 64-44]|nr:MAG: hypothetical protein ABS76_30750 [Pelagibacterium sp. SCN 64-44]